MGFFIHPYAVRVDAVRAAVGSASAPLGARLSQLEMSPVVHDRAHALLRGDPVHGEGGLAALEQIVRALGGELLENDQWAPFRSAWPDDVDHALAAAGVVGRVSALVYGPPLVLIPGAGAAAVTGLDGRRVHGVLKDFAGWERARSPEREAAGQVVSWLEAARARETGLLTFLIG